MGWVRKTGRELNAEAQRAQKRPALHGRIRRKRNGPSGYANGPLYFKNRKLLERGAAEDWLFGLGGGLGWKERGHFADHGQDEALVAFGEGGAVLLDFGEEADFILAEFAEHFLGFFVAWGFGAGEKVGERNFHGFSNLCESFKRRDGVAVFDAREVATKQSGAALDVALGKSPLAAVGFDNFADVYLWFLFRHGFLQSN